MKVWIIEHNTQYDGGYIEAVCTSRDIAIKYMEKEYPKLKLIQDEYNNDEWEVDDETWFSITESQVIGE